MWKIYQGVIFVAVAGSIEAAVPHQYGLAPALLGAAAALIATALPLRVRWFLADRRGRRGKP